MKVKAIKNFFAPGFQLVAAGDTVDLDEVDANVAIGSGKAEKASAPARKAAKSAAKDE